jgi:D-alanyl-D-alanine carboxypeptidase
VLRRALVLAVVVALLAGGARVAAAADPPPVEARAVVVADGRTGDVLYERNADRRIAIASITKLMTALVTLERARPGDTVTIPRGGDVPGGSSIFLVPGERLSVHDLLAAALIQSANDAAYALARHVGDGSVKRFVRLMNAKASELGLEDTHFARPDGLDAPGHYSTAEDVLRLARIAMEEPLVRRLVRRKAYHIAGGRTLHTWNDLLATYPGLYGVKTGHTDHARWSEVAAARRDGSSTWAVVLGSPTRAKRNAAVASLLDWGSDQYARFTLVRGGERYATAAIPFSDERLELVAAGSASRVVRLGDGTAFVERVVAPETVELPVAKGQKLGEVVVLDGARVVARRPLVASRDLSAPSFGERLGWYADRTLDEAGDVLSSIVPGL